MATKKWFGLAAVVAAVGGAIGYVLTKVRKGTEEAEVTQGESGGSEQVGAEMETAAF